MREGDQKQFPPGDGTTTIESEGPLDLKAPGDMAGSEIIPS